jgi:hypothetical protein
VTRGGHAFGWTRLHLPVPTRAEDARAALTALASLAGQPRIVLEATGTAGSVSWRIGCEHRLTRRVLTAIEAHLEGLRTEPLPQTFDSWWAEWQAASVRFPGDANTPLRRDGLESATRGLLAALSQTTRRERLTVQLILGPRSRPTTVRPDAVRDRRAAALKHAEHGFGCEVRLAASSDDPARSRVLVDTAAAALRALEAPGVRVRLARVSPAAVVQVTSPYLWKATLSVSDLVPLTGWPVGELPLPGVASPHPRRLPVPRVVPTSGRRLGRATVSPERRVALSVGDSLRHLHVIGPTGVGKSTVLANLALDDMRQGGGVVVIDPKGDLISDLLARIPAGREDDVVLLDALDEAPVGLGAFAGNAELSADTLLSVFHSLYADSWGPRTHDILHGCLLTLARRGDASIAMVPLLLTNPGFRRSVAGRLSTADPMGLGSFWSWFDGISDAERQVAIAPLMNKLRPILLRPGIRGVLGQRRPRFALSEVFTKRRILLVSLAKGQLGPESARLLGSLVVALLWNAALRRTAIPAERRHPVMVHIDEIQDYLRLPGDLGDALAQARARRRLHPRPPAPRPAAATPARRRYGERSIPYCLPARGSRRPRPGQGFARRPGCRRLRGAADLSGVRRAAGRR